MPATMPTKEEIHLFRVLAPKFVGLIPNAVIAHDKPEDVAQDRKEQLKQFIVAGAGLFDLALDIESGELTETLKKKLNDARAEFKLSNAKLVNKNIELKEISKRLESSIGTQRLDIKEQQISAMLDMLDVLTSPLYTASTVFRDLNEVLISKLLMMLEVLPVIKQYLIVGQGKATISLSEFMRGKLGEMVTYTDTQRKIASNLKIYMNQLKNLHDTCQKDLAECNEKSAITKENRLPILNESPALQSKPDNAILNNKVVMPEYSESEWQ